MVDPDSDRKNLVTLAQVLHAGKQRKSVMDAAIAAFRALLPHERVQFLVNIEAEIADAWTPQALATQAPPPPQKNGKVGAPLKYDAATTEHVLTLASAKLTNREISEKTGIPHQSVHNLKRRAGATRVRARDLVTTPEPEPSDDRLAKRLARGTEIARLHEVEHWTFQKIADRVGVSAGRVAQIYRWYCYQRDGGELPGVPPAPAVAASSDLPDGKHARRLARGARITQLRESGWTYPRIAAREGVTSVRVREIHRWHCRQRELGRTAPTAPAPAAPSAPKAKREVAPRPVDKPAEDRARPRSPKSKVKRDKSGATADSEDSPSIYLREIGKHNLLEKSEELDLAAGIERAEVGTWRDLLDDAKIGGDRVRAIVDRRLEEPVPVRWAASSAAVAKKLRALDLDRDLVEAVFVELGDAVPATALRLRAEAVTKRDRFVRSNLRLVVSMARRYKTFGLPMADLIQEGNLGLVHAVPRFDPRRGLRFSTYATWWIKHHIQRANSDKSRAVRIPVHLQDAMTTRRRHEAKLTGELGRPPTIAEIAASSGLAEKKLTKLADLYPAMGPAASLDAPMSSGESGEDSGAFVDALVDPNETTTVASLLADEDRAKVVAALERLSPVDRQVLRQRFGFDGGAERTLKEIGDDRGLSRERIRQIERQAIKQLRRIMAAVDAREGALLAR